LVEIPCQLLLEGSYSCYPSIDPSDDDEDWFRIYPEHKGSTTYIVHDFGLDLKTLIRKSKLELPIFNIVSWYQKILEKSQIYNSMYLAKSLEILEDNEPLNVYSAEPVGSSSSINTRTDNTSNNEIHFEDFTREELEGYQLGKVGDIFANHLNRVLIRCAPFPGDENMHWTESCFNSHSRFEITRDKYGWYCIYDRRRMFECYIAPCVFGMTCSPLGDGMQNNVLGRLSTASPEKLHNSGYLPVSITRPLWEHHYRTEQLIYLAYVHLTSMK